MVYTVTYGKKGQAESVWGTSEEANIRREAIITHYGHTMEAPCVKEIEWFKTECSLPTRKALDIGNTKDFARASDDLPW